MEPIKYKTKISRTGIPIPKHILQRLDEGIEVEVVFRPVRRAPTNRRGIKKVIDQIETEMNKKYPNLRSSVNKRLRGIVGLSSDIHDDLLKYTDKEILSMARMEKYIPD
ncbi:MAG: hypothetical protein GWP10_22250 [Nitrospiraceae bacterium]|nr:hypothetical protein [Nitrospiraceae bacterium]